jgi:hypothetical protein
MSRIDLRLNGLSTDIETFVQLLQALQQKDLIQVIETSQLYKNRNAQTFRCYIELNMKFSHSDVGEQ